MSQEIILTDEISKFSQDLSVSDGTKLVFFKFEICWNSFTEQWIYHLYTNEGKEVISNIAIRPFSNLLDPVSDRSIGRGGIRVRSNRGVKPLTRNSFIDKEANCYYLTEEEENEIQAALL